MIDSLKGLFSGWSFWSLKEVELTLFLIITELIEVFLDLVTLYKKKIVPAQHRP